MVKVRGPLFSVDAAGTFAKAVVFQHNMYGVYVRRKELLRKTNTFSQALQNAEFSQAIEDWRRSNDDVKSLFRRSLGVFGLTAYASFLKQWFVFRNNAVYGFGRYGSSVVGVANFEIPKENIF